MTPTWCCGFECGSGHWGSASNFTYSTSTVRSGARAGRFNATTAVSAATATIPSTLQVVGGFFIYFATLPSVDTPICALDSSATGPNIFFKSSNSTLQSAVGASRSGSTNFVVTTGRWYHVDFNMLINTGGNDTFFMRVDGNFESNSTVATGLSAASTSFVFGSFTASTHDFFIDDVILSYTDADYPIGDGYVNHFVPTSDGTHTAATTTTVKGTIATPVGTAITSATTDAFNWVNGVPLLGGATDNTRLINAQTAASTTYVEVKFGPAPGIATPAVAPRAVEVITADREASTASGDFTVKLNDNGTENTVFASGAAAGTVTDKYNRKHYATAPTGGAWNANSSGAAAFNNIRARFGYSSDATPDQYWRGIMIEAWFVPIPPGPYTSPYPPILAQ